ncbi:MAG: tetratricopeptide repeat-containing sensor histidine kinase [Sphingobacteriaceae bacterium]|nr:tetratricopeptide repeat-containing sensor histidine kinase [Sphingobacteriaceae bacterium]
MLFASFTTRAQTTKVDQLLGMLNSNNTDSAQISILRKLSAAYTAVDPVKKFYYANQYRLIGEKKGIDSVVANAYLDMGISCGIRGKLDSSLYYFNLGFEKAKQSNYTMGIARGYTNLGFTYDKLERKKDAVKNYEEALKIYRKLNYKNGISQNIVNLGSIYYDLDENKTADIYFREYLDIVKENPNNQIGLGNAYFSLGNSNLKLGKLNVSMDYYKKSLAIRTKIGDISGIALSNWGLGQVYLEKKEYINALKYLKVALTTNSQVKNPYQDAVILITTSRAHLGLKDYKEAQKNADLALIKAKESNSKGLVTEVLDVQIDIKAAQNEFAKALKLQSDYISIKDSIDKSNSKKDVFINDLNRINSDNKKLEKDNQSIIAKNADYTVVISVISLLLIVVVLSLIFYYIRNAEKKANNILLQNQKQEIAEVNEELITQMNIVSAQNIELEKLNNVKNKFFSIVSHDLRGPINNLKMLFELYNKGILDEKELNGLLIKLEDNIYSTASFLDNLLEWAKSQLEGVIVSPINVSLQQVVLENIKLVDSQIKFKGLNVESKIGKEITAFVDPNVINIVVRNLLSNAIKFCSKGDEIIFEAKLNHGEVLFSIKDNGPGISDERKHNLFNLAYSNSIGSSNEKGYQLGLILCKDMITQSGGSISVESKLGEGTLFKISLPANG